MSCSLQRLSGAWGGLNGEKNRALIGREKCRMPFACAMERTPTSAKPILLQYTRDRGVVWFVSTIVGTYNIVGELLIISYDWQN